MPMTAVPPPMMLSTMAAAAAAIPATSPTSTVPVTFARDAIIAWFRGEFAAANAIIDSLCSHLTELSQLNDEKVISGSKRSDYDAVFAAIHRRRLNWIPILNMQKYFSIADVPVELNRVIDSKKQKKIISNNNNNSCSDDIEIVEEEEKKEVAADFQNQQTDESEKETVVEEAAVSEEEELKKSSDDSGNEEISSDDYDSSDRKSSDDDHHEGWNLAAENIQICSNHEDCETRRDNIKMTKGFIAKEPVKGHMVNVVKGLKLYEDIFTDSELSKLRNYINDLRHAGRSGELSGDTFILFNQQLKGNKRELIQLGVPIFGQIRDEKTKSEKTGNSEPIPSVLQAVIDHLSQWHLIPESRKPNSCIINFFDEGEYSQPFLKPPHLDQPISTFLLSESTMAFGRVLVSDNNGNYKGPLMLSLKEGSLLVMRGNSADMAKHVICSSENKRVSMTFFKVRTDMNHTQPSTIPPVTTAMTLWQPGMPQPYRVQDGYGPMEVIPKWGLLHAPLIMLAPARPMLMNPRKISNAGTGVFLPWTMKSKKPAKHLPPRAQRARLLRLPSSMETQVVESTSHSAVAM